MRKPLTDNISQYDEKLNLKINSHTVAKGAVALAVTVPIGFLLNLVLNWIFWVPVCVLIFAALLILLLGTEPDTGMPLYRYVLDVLRIALLPGRIKPYDHRNDSDRLWIDTEEKGEDK